ncbi:MAG TPA: hypothetical protein VGG05_11910 [Pseudonocardiaceae bacterium]
MASAPSNARSALRAAETVHDDRLFTDPFAAHLAGAEGRRLTSRGWRPEVTLISSVGNRLGRWPYPEVPRGTPGVGQGYFARGSR